MLTPTHSTPHALPQRLPSSHSPGHIQINNNYIKTRYAPGIRTHDGKNLSHNRSLGNDLADALANQVADGHLTDTTFTACLHVSFGTLTWPYTRITPPQGDPTAFRYTNLRSEAYKHNIKHTHTPLAHTTKHGALLARAAADGAGFSLHKTHASRNNVQFTHKQDFMWGNHNTRRLVYNTSLRCPMRGQFTNNNGRMTCICPSMLDLPQDRHNSAL
jgi:hypothetical protein